MEKWNEGGFYKRYVTLFIAIQAAFDFLAAATANTSAALNVPSIACTGHFAVQIPQPMHFVWSMTWSFLSSPDAALTGHTLAQIRQPIQVSSINAFGRRGIKSATAFVGHFGTQRPQTLHLARSIRERLFPIEGASKGQTFTQMPHAMHPVWQFSLVALPVSFE